MGFFAALLGWLMMFIGSPAMAEVTSLEEVTVVGSKERAQTLPGSAAYIDQDQIREHSYDDVGKLLRQVPGVYVRDEEGYGQFPNISLRGVDPGRSQKVTIMEDGILTAPAPYSAPAAYYSPTTGRMSGIEVLKGTSQVKYGPHTTGGVINYLSTPIPQERQMYLKGSGGSNFDARAHGYLGDTLNTSFGKVGYLVEHYFRSTDGFKTINEKPGISNRDETGFENSDSTLKLSWEPETSLDQKFQLKLGYTDHESDETYMGLFDDDFSDNPYQRYPASRFDHFDSNHFRSSLQHAIELKPGLKLTTTGYYNKFHRDWFKLNGGGRDLSDDQTRALWKGEAAGTLPYRDNNRDYWLSGVESVLGYDFPLSDWTNHLEFGTRYHWDRVRRFQRNVNFTQDANGAITARNETAWGSGSAGNRREDANALAFFLQDEIKKDAWTFLPGIRYESIDYSYRDYDTTGTDPQRVTASGSKTLDVLAGGAGAQYRLSDSWSLFGGVHRGFSVPAPRDFVRSGIHEETSIGTELGARYNNQRGFSTEAIFFYTGFNDLIVVDNVGGGGTAATQNVGEVSSLGVEYLAEYDLGLARNWSFSNPYRFSFTYTDAELQSDASSATESDDATTFSFGTKGKKVPYIPEYQFQFGTGLGFTKWDLSADLIFVDETFTTASNTSNQNEGVNGTGTPNSNVGKTDAIWTLDLSAHYKMTENDTFFVNLDNVFDREYMVARHPIGPRPGKPFTFTAGVEKKF